MARKRQTMFNLFISGTGSQRNSLGTSSGSLTRFWCLTSLLLTVGLLFSGTIQAQEPSDKADATKEQAQKDKANKPVEALLPKPVIILNIASVERILQDIDLIF